MIAMELIFDRQEPLVLEGSDVIGDNYRAVWFLVKGEGWDIAAVYRPDGAHTGYYVDVLDPVIWSDAEPGTLLPIVDLFLDIWIWPDGRYQVLDEDEFAEAVSQGWISPRQRDHALRVLGELETGIRQGTFPPREVREIAEQ
jgi:predicted RNA-binding protein associated with RNAse of E/G family